ncbi:MAG: MBL fold metallo-hydrolase [Candidatus Hodarchaeota archaeon]
MDHLFESIGVEKSQKIANICKFPWQFQVEPFRIAGNLYYVGNSDVSSHLIDTGDGLVLIDTTYPQTVYLLLESIRNLGFDPRDVKLLFHCHGHYDHFGGTKAIAEMTGAKTLLGKDDIYILEDRPELSWAPEYGVDFYEFFDIDTPLEDGDEISLGNTTIKCINVPGHTPGAMAYFFNIDKGGETYHVGIHGGPGLNTLQDEYLARYDLSSNSRQQYSNSLYKVMTEDVDIHLGAHPGQNNTLAKRKKMGDGKNPFIDSDAWSSFLHQLLNNFNSQFLGKER